MLCRLAQINRLLIGCPAVRPELLLMGTFETRMVDQVVGTHFLGTWGWEQPKLGIRATFRG